MSLLPDPLDHRTPEHPIESIFLRRWSPRAMNGEPLADQPVRPNDAQPRRSARIAVRRDADVQRQGVSPDVRHR